MKIVSFVTGFVPPQNPYRVALVRNYHQNRSTKEIVLQVTNWDKWQTFRKDRGTPPWIKVYRNLLTNEQWVDLTDAEKGQLVSIWILAADKDGQIPDNPKMIQRMSMMTSTPNINKFIDLGFLTPTCQPVGNHMATNKMNHDDNLTHQRRGETEKSREDEIRVEEILCDSEIVEVESYPFDEFWNLFANKKALKDCTKIWTKLTNVEKDECISAIPKYLNYLTITGYNQLHPKTWLNGKRWADDFTAPTNNKSFQNPKTAGNFEACQDFINEFRR